MEDYALERLLELDGEVFVVSEDGKYWVKFEVHRVPPTLSKPHGLDYSLTLHGPDMIVSSDLITHIPLRRRSGASRKTIDTLGRAQSHTNIPMQRNS